MSVIYGTDRPPIAAEFGQYVVVRHSELDRIRGVAIVLMILDHIALFVPGGIDAIDRWSVTRFALPLFCLVAGSLHRPWRSIDRILTLVLVGVAMSIYWYFFTGSVLIDVVFWIATGLLLMPWISTLPGVLLCVLQLVYWQISYSSYDPGLVWLFLALGHMGGKLPLLRFGSLLSPWWAVIGRRPLSWYCGHLVMLGVLFIYGKDLF